MPFDMGGTSTDISLVADGHAALSSEGTLAGQRIALRSLDIASIAAGGGSIASVDSGGSFKVGPESAGSVPGPACYGNGGTAATVTDANVVLGYLDAATFMGGKRPLDREASLAAVDRLAEKLGISRMEAAAGIYRLINVKMADGIRLMTLRRGVDPRRFTLLSFGGAAGLHACQVARELDITRIVVPTMASVLSAWGMLTTDLRYELGATHFETGSRTTAEDVRRIFTDLEEKAGARLRSWYDGPIRIERSAEMRYGEQIFEVDVPLTDVDLSHPGLMEEIAARFHQRHQDLYTYASPGQEVVFVNARVAAVGAVAGDAGVQTQTPADSACTPSGHRQIYLAGWQTVPIYRLETLAPGNVIEGPAVIEAETTTVIAGPGDVIRVNGLGWLEIELPPRAS